MLDTPCHAARALRGHVPTPKIYRPWKRISKSWDGTPNLEREYTRIFSDELPNERDLTKEKIPQDILLLDT